jgi:hypothetical protein
MLLAVLLISLLGGVDLAVPLLTQLVGIHSRRKVLIPALIRRHRPGITCALVTAVLVRNRRWLAAPRNAPSIDPPLWVEGNATFAGFILLFLVIVLTGQLPRDGLPIALCGILL